MIILRSLAYHVSFYLWTGILGILGLPLLLAPGMWVMRFGTFWSAGTLTLLRWCVGLSYEVRGQLPPGPVLIAMKHQSAWEAFAVPVIFRAPVMVIKRELGYVPFYGWYAMKAGMIGIDRSGGASALKSMVVDAKRARTAGRPIVIFPEGTRTPVGARVPYQPGVIALYRQLDLPLVPVAVNSGLFWGRRHFIRRPGRVIVEILPAIPPGGERREVMTLLEARIEEVTDRLVAAAEVKRV